MLFRSAPQARTRLSGSSDLCKDPCQRVPLRGRLNSAAIFENVPKLFGTDAESCERTVYSTYIFTWLHIVAAWHFSSTKQSEQGRPDRRAQAVKDCADRSPVLLRVDAPDAQWKRFHLHRLRRAAAGCDCSKTLAQLNDPQTGVQSVGESER